jgi:periplasmic protein CpxP/Spy
MKALLLARAASALVLTTILAGGLGTSAFAQTATPPATPPVAMAPAGAGSSSSRSTTATAPSTATATHHTRAKRAARRASATMTQMAEQRITDLHSRLKITAAQQSQWDQFAQVMRDNAKDLDTAYQQRASSFDTMNAVENMQSYAQIEQTRAQDMQKLVPAFQALYTVLSDPQKQRADQLFRNQAVRAAQRHGAAAAATH